MLLATGDESATPGLIDLRTRKTSAKGDEEVVRAQPGWLGHIRGVPQLGLARGRLEAQATRREAGELLGHPSPDAAQGAHADGFSWTMANIHAMYTSRGAKKCIDFERGTREGGKLEVQMVERAAASGSTAKEAEVSTRYWLRARAATHLAAPRKS